MKLKVKKINDAAESNAGDDFHILWSVRKCLELLNFEENGLKALTIEGLDNDDNKIIDESGELLLGVDICEYYGGDKIDSATKVIVSQLKYSTRRANTEWTTSRITTDSKGRSTGSIIGRLSIFFHGFLNEFGSSAALDKLLIKLISNRPISNLLSTTISAAQSHLKNDAKIKTVAALKKRLDRNQQIEMDALFRATKLTQKAFLLFLQILDFADCGTGSRLYQRQQIIKAIGSLGSSISLIEYSHLRDLVWGKMMPEQKRFNKIRIEDVLYKFGLSDIHDLLPVVPKFEDSKNVIIREEIVTISQQIIHSQQNVICLHAGAGMGKSTFVRQLEERLPKDSICILFDCYGNGAYDDIADKRHVHAKAILQICNELALKIGSPLLLKTDGSIDYYIQELKKRIIDATSVLKNVNPFAILSIIIDAADNSVAAGLKYNEKSFVNDITQMDLPENCRIILTTRTSRISTLALPDDVVSIPLSSFSIPETTLYLQNIYKNISTEDIQAFWYYTKAVPRVMAYSLELPGNNIQEKISFLKPNGKSLEDIFVVKIKEAGKKTGNIIRLNNFLKFLAFLPSPVPANHLQELANLSEQWIADIGTDLWHGLIIENNNFSFRDEDFETYIRSKYILENRDFECAANHFLSNAENDEYASIHLGLILSKSDKRSQLVPVVLERKYLSLPKDPVKNRETFVERTKLAMQFCDPSNFDFLKIQMIAAEAAKTNKTLEEILIDRSDLASIYADEVTNQKIYLQSGNVEKFGSAHYRSAAILSRKKETKYLAEKHLKQARKWAEYRLSLPEEKRHDFILNEFDIANGAEAVLRITEDINECIEWVNGWRPKELLFSTINKLVENILSDSSFLSKIDLSSVENQRVDIQLLIVSKFFNVNRKLPFKIDKILSELPKLKSNKAIFSNHLLEVIVSFTEYLFSIHYDKDEIVEWLSLCEIDPPMKPPRFYSTDIDDSNVKMDIFFRQKVLLGLIKEEEVAVTDLYPKQLVITSQDENEVKRKSENERKEFDQIYKYLLPLYQIRLTGILKTTNKKKLEEQLQKFLELQNSDFHFTYRLSHRLQEAFLFMALKLLDVVFFNNNENLISIIKSSYSIKNRNNIKLHIIIARQLVKNTIFNSQVIKLLANADDSLSQSSLPARDQIDFYADLAIIASKISHLSGKHYFDKMVIASNEVDLEAHEQIKGVYYMIGESEFFFNSKLAKQFAHYIEFCWTRLKGWDHFPWIHGIKGITKLDVGTAFSIICQWDHKGIGETREHFIEVLLLALRSKFLTPEITGGILPINEIYWEELIEVIEIILREFDRTQDHSKKSFFVQDIIRDLKLRCTSSRSFFLLDRLLDIIDDGKHLDTEIVNEFRDYCSRVKLLATEIDDERHPFINEKKTILNKKYRELILHEKKYDLNGIEKIISKAKSYTKNEYVDELLLFNLIQEQIPDAESIGYLEELTKLDKNLVSYYNYADILLNALNRWNHYPEVKNWKSKVFELLIRRRFLSFCSHDYINVGGIKRLAEIFEISNTLLATAIKAIIPEYVSQLSTNALYQLFSLTTLGLNKVEKELFIEWSLTLWNKKNDNKHLDYQLTDGNTKQERSLIVASFLRYHLGHPDKRVRWKAVHSIRRLTKLGEQSILNILLEKQNEKICNLFSNPKFNFFWMSAKVYLWIAIEKVCRESPGTIRHLAQLFYHELMSNALPHAQINFFIRNACLLLYEYGDNLYTEEQIRNVETFFQSNISIQPKRINNTERKKGKANKRTRFNFDVVDTLPYWYDPLGRIFNLSSFEVAVIADKYIAEYWGYCGDVNDLEDYGKDIPYELKSNNHGSEPTVENLQTYLEYHAMFCVASELLKLKPFAGQDQEEEHFDDWLSSWGNTWKEFWLSDLRDPLPLEKKYWNKIRNEAEWEWSFSLEDFERGIGIKDSIYPGYL